MPLCLLWQLCLAGNLCSAAISAVLATCPGCPRLRIPPRLCCPPSLHAQGAYHGRTYGAMALTTSKTVYRQTFGPFPSGTHGIALYC